MIEKIIGIIVKIFGNIEKIFGIIGMIFGNIEKIFGGPHCCNLGTASPAPTWSQLQNLDFLQQLALNSKLNPTQPPQKML